MIATDESGPGWQDVDSVEADRLEEALETACAGVAEWLFDRRYDWRQDRREGGGDYHQEGDDWTMRVEVSDPDDPDREPLTRYVDTDDYFVDPEREAEDSHETHESKQAG
jgi:hypothetical protein